MANFRYQKKAKQKFGLNSLIKKLSEEIKIDEYKVKICFDKLSLDYTDEYFQTNYSLSKEIVCSFYGILDDYIRSDEAKIEFDASIKRFDEVYIDTAPLIHEDWFLYFIANASLTLRKRRKKLVILEKIMEELSGISHYDEKDRDVRLRAQVRPYLLQRLAKKGLVTRIDTGSAGIADDHLISLFKKRGKNHNILLITQDRYLSERVVELGENLNKNIDIPSRSFFERLKHGMFVDEDIVKKVVVCELLKNGDLLRLYICQHCGDSYYDKMFDCEGYVICSSCYYDIENERQKQIAIKEKEEKNRLKEIKEKEEKRQLEENLITVGKIIKKKQKKTLLVIISVLILLVIIGFLFL